VLQKASEQVTECLERAAEAEVRAKEIVDPQLKAEFERMAASWRTLARSYEFQGSLGRFISFNNGRVEAFKNGLAEAAAQPPLVLPPHTSASDQNAKKATF
jgi:hypothetical protein